MMGRLRAAAAAFFAARPEVHDLGELRAEARRDVEIARVLDQVQGLRGCLDDFERDLLAMRRERPERGEA